MTAADRDSPPDAETQLATPGDHRDHLRLWLRLFTCHMLMETEVRSRLRQQFSVTLPRFDLMAQLDRVPHGLTLGELSRRLMVSNGNVTGLVDRLVASGHLDRAPHATDRRSSTVRLTPAGRAAFDAMAAAHARWISAMQADLSDEERQALFSLLGQLKDSVRAGITREGLEWKRG